MPGRPSVDVGTIERIKQLKDRGFTVREIAKKLNISVGTVSKYNPFYMKTKYK